MSTVCPPTTAALSDAGLTLTRFNNTALAGPGVQQSLVTSLENIAAGSKPSSLLLTGRLAPAVPGRYGFQLHFTPPLPYPSSEAYARYC
jgi:hypothetical protein